MPELSEIERLDQIGEYRLLERSEWTIGADTKPNTDCICPGTQFLVIESGPDFGKFYMLVNGDLRTLYPSARERELGDRYQLSRFSIGVREKDSPCLVEADQFFLDWKWTGSGWRKSTLDDFRFIPIGGMFWAKARLKRQLKSRMFTRLSKDTAAIHLL